MPDLHKGALEGLMREHPHILDLSKIIQTDADGRIVLFVPIEGMKWSLVFFIQNLMIQQRLQEVDEFLAKYKR